jgi:hypothetical protein
MGDVAGTYGMANGAINAIGEQLTIGDFSVPPEMAPPSTTGGWELWTNPRNRAFYDPTVLDNVPRDTTAYNTGNWRTFLEGKYGQDNVTPKPQIPDEGAANVIEELRTLMAKEEYAKLDLTQLEELVNQDLQNFDVQQIWTESTAIGGRYAQEQGAPGTMYRTSGLSDVDNLGHEWIHFDGHRERGWRVATDSERLLEEIKAHEWQLKHAKEFDYHPTTIFHNEEMIRHYNRILQKYYPE